MRVLIVSQYFPPEGLHIPPTLAHSLASMGHEVMVITGYPNYPAGKIYSGFRQQWRGFEVHGKVKLIRVPLYMDHSSSTIRRILNYVSFAVSVTTARKFARDSDVVYVYATQMTPALGPWLWRLIGGSPYVLHIQDLWPDSITGSSLMGTGRKRALVNAALRPWLRSLYKHAEAVIGIAPTMVKTLIERGVDPNRAHVIYNWSEEPRSGGADSVESGGYKMRFLYAGNIGDMQDLETVIEAARLSQDLDVVFSIVGDGVALPRIRDLAAKMKLSNVEFKGRVSRLEVGTLYNSADFALVTLKDLPAFKGTIPSKFQAALAHGVPVITTVQGDLRQLVEEQNVGYTCDVESPHSLARAIRKAVEGGSAAQQALAKNARSSFETHFAPDSGTAAVEEVLVAAATKSNRNGRS